MHSIFERGAMLHGLKRDGFRLKDALGASWLHRPHPEGPRAVRASRRMAARSERAPWFEEARARSQVYAGYACYGARLLTMRVLSRRERFKQNSSRFNLARCHFATAFATQCAQVANKLPPAMEPVTGRARFSGRAVNISQAREVWRSAPRINCNATVAAEGKVWVQQPSNFLSRSKCL